MSPRGDRAAGAVVGAVAARLGWTALTSRPPAGASRWRRTNHRGEPITLLEGPAAVAGLAAGIVLVPGLPRPLRAAGAVAALGSGAVGLLDDLAEQGASKGLRGHLGALRRGEITTGLVKIVGIGVSGLLAAAMARPRDGGAGRVVAVLDVLGSGALVAGTANLVNLFDLRPGRALKVVLLHAPALVSPGPGAPLVAVAVGTAAALLPEDLAERAMLGDCGANSLGAVLGTAAVATRSRRGRLAALTGVVALILASEKVSFTRVIAATPGLREFDQLGRRPR